MKDWEYHLHEHVWVDLYGHVEAGTEHTIPKEPHKYIAHTVSIYNSKRGLLHCT